MAESVIFLREQGIKSVKQLDDYIQKVADERQDLQDKIKAIDKEMQELSATMKQVHTFKKYRQYYKEYKANLSDKAFFEEYKAQIILYENALSELKKSYSKFPNSRCILDKLDKLQEKKATHRLSRWFFFSPIRRMLPAARGSACRSVICNLILTTR